MDQLDFEYAVEQTEILHSPERRIETFGTTVFRFYVLSELMDSIDSVRVRDGEIQAEKPQIISPGNYANLSLDGFGERAEEFTNWLRQNEENLAIFRYAFQIKKSNVHERVINESMSTVTERIEQEIRKEEDEMAAIIRGVDEAWEVSLLKFTIDMIRRSAGRNLGDLRDEGLI